MQGPLTWLLRVRRMITPTGLRLPICQLGRTPDLLGLFSGLSHILSFSGSVAQPSILRRRRGQTAVGRAMCPQVSGSSVIRHYKNRVQRR